MSRLRIGKDDASGRLAIVAPLPKMLLNLFQVGGELLERIRGDTALRVARLLYPPERAMKSNLAASNENS